MIITILLPVYLPVCENAVLSDSLAHALRTWKSVDNKFSDIESIIYGRGCQGITDNFCLDDYALLCSH